MKVTPATPFLSWRKFALFNLGMASRHSQKLPCAASGAGIEVLVIGTARRDDDNEVTNSGNGNAGKEALLEQVRAS